MDSNSSTSQGVNGGIAVGDTDGVGVNDGDRVIVRVTEGVTDGNAEGEGGGGRFMLTYTSPDDAVDDMICLQQHSGQLYMRFRVTQSRQAVGASRPSSRYT